MSVTAKVPLSGTVQGHKDRWHGQSKVRQLHQQVTAASYPQLKAGLQWGVMVLLQRGCNKRHREGDVDRPGGACEAGLVSGAAVGCAAGAWRSLCRKALRALRLPCPPGHDATAAAAAAASSCSSALQCKLWHELCDQLHSPNRAFNRAVDRLLIRPCTPLINLRRLTKGFLQEEGEERGTNCHSYQTATWKLQSFTRLLLINMDHHCGDRR